MAASSAGLSHATGYLLPQILGLLERGLGFEARFRLVKANLGGVEAHVRISLPRVRLLNVLVRDGRELGVARRGVGGRLVDTLLHHLTVCLGTHLVREWRREREDERRVREPTRVKAKGSGEGI